MKLQALSGDLVLLLQHLELSGLVLAAISTSRIVLSCTLTTFFGVTPAGYCQPHPPLLSPDGGKQTDSERGGEKKKEKKSIV